MKEIDWRTAICEYLQGVLKLEELLDIADLKKCHICGHVDLEEYMHENEDGIYCDTCWISRK